MPLAVENSGARHNPAFLANPPGEQVLRDGAIVVVMGGVNDVRRVELFPKYFFVNLAGKW